VSKVMLNACKIECAELAHSMLSFTLLF